jgi:glutathione synthase/RimK-type ligase-like ATP-grasp enzyme
VRWNSHKFYLRELERAGIAIVPTEFLARDEQTDLVEILNRRHWDRAVIKPAVSADSFATERAELASPAAGEAHLAMHLPQRDMLVQAYMPAVEEPGERCLVAIDGTLSHAVRKRSKFLGGRHTGPEGVPVEIAADEAAAAERILGYLPAVPLYARIDLIRNQDGAPCLMELELVEPSLFFEAGVGSANRFVAALARRLGG